MGIRIVTCDDEAHITRAVSMKLTKAGFDVESACDGQAAWEAIERELPALLITDCQMPRLNGLKLCERLRADSRTRELPVILLTAKGYELDGDQITQELGIAKLIFKPFSPRELLATVQEIVGVAETVDTTIAPGESN